MIFSFFDDFQWFFSKYICIWHLFKYNYKSEPEIRWRFSLIFGNDFRRCSLLLITLTPFSGVLQ